MSKYLKKLFIPVLALTLMIPAISVHAESVGKGYITIRSLSQTQSGGTPVYRLLNTQTGESKKIVVRSNNGEKTQVDYGVYKIKEIQSAPGYKPENPDDIVIEIPHKSESGSVSTDVSIDMKSYKETPEKPTPNKPDKPTPDKPIVDQPNEPQTDEPMEEEPWDPVKLEERKTEETPQDDPKEEPEKEEDPIKIKVTKEDLEQKEVIKKEEGLPQPNKTTNPKTADDSFTMEAVLAGVGLAVVGGIVLVLKKKKNSEN